jgi:hypothetical protein
MTGTQGDRRVVAPLPRSASARHHERSARLAAAERRIGAVSHVLDDLVTVPGTGRRVGVEPVLGLVPGAGDLISAAVGVWLILEATRFKLPGVVIARMALNTFVDLVVGLVPILGDLFDFAFKSNTRNVALFRRYAADPTASTREHTLVLIGAVVALVGIAWLFVAAVGWLFSIEIGLP